MVGQCHIWDITSCQCRCSSGTLTQKHSTLQQHSHQSQAFGVPTCAPAPESNTTAGETDFSALLATTHFCWVPGCCFHPCSVHKKNQKNINLFLTESLLHLSSFSSSSSPSSRKSLLPPPPTVSHMLTSSYFSADA